MELRAAAIAAICIGICSCDARVGKSNERQGAAPPPLGACLDANREIESLGAIEVEGEVEEVGFGMPTPSSAGDCPFAGTLQFGLPGFGDAALLAQVSWVRVRDAANGSIVLSALAEGFGFPLTAGDLVRARLGVQSVGFAGEVSAFEVRTADGSLLFWVGFGTQLGDLETPDGVVLTPGEVEAEIEDDCLGSYNVRALGVDVEGTTLSVPSGARVEAGPWIVVNAVLHEQTGTSSCTDASSGLVRAAIWTRTARVPDSGGIGGPCYANVPIEQAEGAPQYLCLPDATLTRPCEPASPCPAESQCVEGLCRP